MKESKIIADIRNMAYEEELEYAKNLSIQYINGINQRSVFPTDEAINNLKAFDEDLNNEPVPIINILEKLNQYGSPATVAQTGSRYFGFVNGGILPSALCSKWLTDTWDQNPALYVMSPIVSKIEEVCEKWLKDLLCLPESTVAGFVSGSSAATTLGLIAGRNYLLGQLGYSAERNGLFNAPGIKVVLGEGAHSTVYKALSMIGLGNERVIKVPCDKQGRIIVKQLPVLDNRTLLILQAGNVNTGAFDDFLTICPLATAAGAWVHVDGAFGLWAAASKSLSHLTYNVNLADSWSVDCHKTLNASYDNGIILCKHKDIFIKSLHMIGDYIIYDKNRDGMLYTAEMSRRARAIDLWATLKGLGKSGVIQLVDELHDKAKYFAELLEKGGLEIVNDVVFNQVLVYYQSDDKVIQLIERVQKSGICWLGGSKWQGKAVMRISVCSYKTSYRDIEISAEDILKQALLI